MRHWSFFVRLYCTYFKQMKSFFISFILLLLPSVLYCQQLFGRWQSDDTAGFTARYGLTSSVLDSKIYTIGGHLDNPPTIVNTLEVYDPAAHTWTTPNTTGTSSRRHYLAACAVQGKIYAIGGGGQVVSYLNNVEVFDPVYNSWTNGAPMPTPRFKLTASEVNGLIYVIGGENKNGFLNTLEVYDPTANSWSVPATGGTFPAMSRMTSSVVNGRIYVIGGYDGLNSLNTVYVFDPASNGWSLLTTTGTFTPREYLSSNVINGKIYVIGGGTDQSNPSDSVSVFDPETNIWSTVITIGTFTPRFALTTSLVNGSIYSLGGTPDLSDGLYNLNEVFTPVMSSVSSTLGSNDIQVYPNPTLGNIAILGENIRAIQIINILGQKIKEINKIATSNITLDLVNIPRGTYYAKCISDNTVTMKLIVKQ
jgi:N-acetylneuraminic acid mutarotase